MPLVLLPVCRVLRGLDWAGVFLRTPAAISINVSFWWSTTVLRASAFRGPWSARGAASREKWLADVEILLSICLLCWKDSCTQAWRPHEANVCGALSISSSDSAQSLRGITPRVLGTGKRAREWSDRLRQNWCRHFTTSLAWGIGAISYAASSRLLPTTSLFIVSAP